MSETILVRANARVDVGYLLIAAFEPRGLRCGAPPAAMTAAMSDRVLKRLSINSMRSSTVSSCPGIDRSVRSAPRARCRHVLRRALQS